MSLLQRFNDLDECEQWNFIDHIKDQHMTYLIRIVNKHYSQSRKEYYKQRYKENPEYRKKISLANKKYQQKKRAEKKDCNNINE
jgi:hypothetical protein